VIEAEDAPLHLAVHCQHLYRLLDPERREPITVCQHPVREGKNCVGPFLDDLSTACGLWEAHPESHLIPLPQPERWQRRRRREGYYDMSFRGKDGRG